MILTGCGFPAIPSSRSRTYVVEVGRDPPGSVEGISRVPTISRHFHPETELQSSVVALDLGPPGTVHLEAQERSGTRKFFPGTARAPGSPLSATPRDPPRPPPSSPESWTVGYTRTFGESTLIVTVRPGGPSGSTGESGWFAAYRIISIRIRNGPTTSWNLERFSILSIS